MNDVNDVCSKSVQRTYTAEQVAEILGVSIRKAYNLCETTNNFKVIRLGKRCHSTHGSMDWAAFPNHTIRRDSYYGNI
jgi:DNA-directed RNA polymerase specialized sigma subunit